MLWRRPRGPRLLSTTTGLSNSSGHYSGSIDVGAGADRSLIVAYGHMNDNGATCTATIGGNSMTSAVFATDEYILFYNVVQIFTYDLSAGGLSGNQTLTMSGGASPNRSGAVAYIVSGLDSLTPTDTGGSTLGTASPYTVEAFTCDEGGFMCYSMARHYGTAASCDSVSEDAEYYGDPQLTLLSMGGQMFYSGFSGDVEFTSSGTDGMVARIASFR